MGTLRCYGVSKNIAEWMGKFPIQVFLMSSHAEKSYLEIEFQDEDWLVLEKQGIRKEVLGQFENHLKIPMSANIRSFNIANSVAFYWRAKDRLR
jgi:tRNA (cytidine/uridine-2'-O-)-methyltransferase